MRKSRSVIFRSCRGSGHSETGKDGILQSVKPVFIGQMLVITEAWIFRDKCVGNLQMGVPVHHERAQPWTVDLLVGGREPRYPHAFLLSSYLVLE
jgi:hypothetical protein